jgi:hypothetical protein
MGDGESVNTPRPFQSEYAVETIKAKLVTLAIAPQGKVVLQYLRQHLAIST